jgi:hypothetical protein
MNYEQAIESVKQGHKVTRKSWKNPDGSSGAGTKALMLVSGAEAPYRGIGRIKIEPFVVLYRIAGQINAFVPTKEEQEAKDYMVFDNP